MSDQVYDYIKKHYKNANISYNKAISLKPNEAEPYIKQDKFEKGLAYLKEIQNTKKDNKYLNDYLTRIRGFIEHHGKMMKGNK